MDPQAGFWERVAENLATSGPLAIVLAAGIVVVWRAYQELNRDFIGFLKSAFPEKDEKKP